MRVDGILNRQPRQFVAERDRVVLEPKHPGGEALVERGDGSPATASSSHSSARGDARPPPRRADHRARVLESAGRARAPRRARLPGSPRQPPASTSVTKNGFPPCRRYSSPASTSGRGQLPTAGRRAEPRAHHAAPWSQARRGRSAADASASSSSSRYVTTTSARRPLDRRASRRSTSSVASSAQCSVLEHEHRGGPASSSPHERRCDFVRCSAPAATSSAQLGRPTRRRYRGTGRGGAA